MDSVFWLLICSHKIRISEYKIQGLSVFNFLKNPPFLADIYKNTQFYLEVTKQILFLTLNKEQIDKILE